MRNVSIALIGVLMAAGWAFLGAQASQVQISGELRQWHRVTLTFTGPQAAEDATPNPFRDYLLAVTFTHGGREYVVPGFYAADGDAANTGGHAGGKWRAHFMPDASGEWRYQVSFRQGPDIALGDVAGAGASVAFDGASGKLDIGPSDKTGRDHRAKGLLRYTGEHYLRFAGTGEYFLKGGADSPENFLAFRDFDQTPGTHEYAPHAGDWRPGDPTWAGGKGKNIIGALNYLASEGMNSVYFITMNVVGDGKDVWPWTSKGERFRFDCSKLDQWEIVFSHMDAQGILLHVLTQETENDQLLDGGELGPQRRLYYRELIARFGHHPALVWNLGEENTNTDAQRKAFARYIRELDPYDHPIVVHTFPGQIEEVYAPLLGYGFIDGTSLQVAASWTHGETLKWRERSAAASHKWVVFLDEIGPANMGVLPDADNPGHDAVRQQVLWSNLMAGGAGCEWYFGYKYAHNDLNCEDWRSRDNMWDMTCYALEFFQEHLPFAVMGPDDSLVRGAAGACLAKPGEIYAIYLPEGGAAELDLGTSTDEFTIRWYNPREGGDLAAGPVKAISGPGWQSLGTPPDNDGRDWAALVR